MITISQMQKYRVDQSGAGGVPMAVPVNCRQNESPNWKMLFSITISRAINKAEGLMPVNSTILRPRGVWSRKFSISGKACLRCMLVYMLFASHVKRNVSLSQRC